MLLRNKSLKQKMLAFSIGASAALLLVGAVGFVEVQNISKRYQTIVESVTKKTDATLDQDQTKKWVGEAESTARFATGAMAGVVLIGFAFTMAVGFFFSRNLSLMLQQTAQQLSDGADEVASASRKISSSAEGLSASSTQQAAAIEQTAASIEEMNSMVSRNADNANRSRTVASASRDTATKGKQVVEQMIQSINEINASNTSILRQIEESNKQIGEIVNVISEIGNKTKVINDIVFQTKLLSFNASVEAARAGEHGKGFAVVAEEVGNLAQMSGNASKEISTMLESSIKRVEGIVNDTRTQVERLVSVGQQKVQAGTEIARRCGEALDEIVTNVSEVNQMVGEISAASADQAQGVQGISKAMSQLDQVTQQNASASQQAASAAVQLSAQVENLRGMAKSLVETVQGVRLVRGAATEQAGEARFALPSNVLRFKKGKVKTTAPAPKASEQARSQELASAPLKKAVGAEAIPSEDDPRFNDV